MCVLCVCCVCVRCVCVLCCVRCVCVVLCFLCKTREPNRRNRNRQPENRTEPNRTGVTLPLRFCPKGGWVTQTQNLKILESSACRGGRSAGLIPLPPAPGLLELGSPTKGPVITAAKLGGAVWRAPCSAAIGVNGNKEVLSSARDRCQWEQGNAILNTR